MTLEELDQLTIGELIDALYDVRKYRSEILMKADLVKDDESFIETYLLNKFGKQGLHGAQGSKAKVSIKEAVHPTVYDWDELYEYIAETGAYDLLQKRISTEAWKLRVNDGLNIQGVTSFIKVTLSMRATT